jgi:hypothetical protein
VRIILGIGPVRYPSAAEFCEWEATSWLLTQPLGTLTGDVREVVIRDLGDVLQVYIDDTGVILPCETYLVTARG